MTCHDLLATATSHPPLAHHVPLRDATVVARLKAAGAIVLRKTNLTGSTAFV